MHSLVRTAALLTLLTTLGCRESKDDNPSDAAITQDGGDVAQFIVRVVDCNSSLFLEGVTLCPLQNGAKGSDCVVTNASGEAPVNLPYKSRTGVFFSMPGKAMDAFLPLWLTKNETILGCAPTEVEIKQQYDAVGSPYPPAAGTGSITVNGSAGAIIEGLGAGEKGPYYVDATGLTSTTTQNMVEPFPRGTLMAVPPGEYDLKVTNAGAMCTLGPLGWPAQGSSVGLPVLDGVETSVAAICP